MFGNLGDAKEMLATARNPGESEQIRSLLGAFAATESEHRAALREHARELGVDPDEAGLTEPPDVEDRIDELAAGISARVNGEPWSTWCEHVAPDDLDGDAAEEFAGINSEEWTEMQESIVREWRTDDDLATGQFSDDQLVDADLQSRFGVDAVTFEEFVVNYSPGRLFEELFAGEMNRNTAGVKALSGE
ncbi:hypothetical protein BRC71_06305 [Halobacteriales archaeon QH_7_65_31]|nr:MAG: hypothetical protein BRC71_06305 [Halobacteriales archaeon QH_7_65_31]